MSRIVESNIEESKYEEIEKYLFHNLQWHTRFTTEATPSLQKDSSKQEYYQQLNTQYSERYLLFPEHKKRDVNIFYRHFEQSKPKAVVFLFHGAGSCSSVLSTLGNHLREQNFEVFAMDQVAHGKTKYVKKGEEKTHSVAGPDCLVESYVHFRDTSWFFIKQMLIQFDSKLSELPVFIWAESMGGKLSIHNTIMVPLLIHMNE
jgi:hypothetical protein